MAEARSVVALVRCESYDPGVVDAAVRRAVDLIGGMAAFVRARESIVLKPNVLYGSPAERCVVTHPTIMAAVARLALAQGARVLYGDSSAIKPPAYNLKRAGLAAVGDQLGLEMADFVTPVPVHHESALIARNLVLAKGVLDADGVICLAKLKTHGLTRFTGAVKNLYGCVPGMTKGRYHAQYPEPRDFCKLLVDVAARVAPRLSVMDGVIAMEGAGPGSGTPRQLRVILASADPVALDSIACRIICLPPSCVPTFEYGEQAGLGNASAEKVTLTGDDIAQFVCRDFDVVRRPPISLGTGKVRRLVRDVVAPRPVIVPSRCVKCGRCVEACPVEPKAVNWRPAGTAHPPRYNYPECIRCFCCHEVCPEKAITVKTPLLGRMVPLFAFVSLVIANIKSRAASGRHE